VLLPVLLGVDDEEPVPMLPVEEPVPALPVEEPVPALPVEEPVPVDPDPVWMSWLVPLVVVVGVVDDEPAVPVCEPLLSAVPLPVLPVCALKASASKSAGDAIHTFFIFINSYCPVVFSWLAAQVFITCVNKCQHRIP